MTLAHPPAGDRAPAPAPAGGATSDSARAALATARAARAAALDRWLASLLAAPPHPEPPPSAGTAAAGEGTVPEGVALVAVGSHARRELTPGGDLDLVLLHRGLAGVALIADRVWYPVWDSGLRLDHSVRTVAEARTVARGDMKAALGLLSARRLAGDHALVDELRAAVLADWRADAPTRLAELSAMCRERWETHGELAFLLEPDLKEAHGGLRDVHVMHAVAASWVAPAPDARVRAAHDLLLDIRHALHQVTGRSTDRLVLQEQQAVARALGLLNADVLQRSIAEAARTVTYGASHLWRRVENFTRAKHRQPPGVPQGAGRRGVERRPVGDGAVEHEGEVVLARNADLNDPALVLRVAAAAAQTGLPLAPATVARLAEHAALPRVPWPAEARDALVSLLGAGPAAIAVWEALDQAGLIVRLLPDWERVRNRPQRNPVHRFTVDRHLVETAAGAAALTREVARPDLLLIGALLHDIGKGWPGDHSTSGAVVARDIGARLGLPEEDVRVLETVVRHHLLLPETATRRDIDDPVTVQTVTAAVSGAPGREREVVDLLAALAVADGGATGPAAWGAWKAGLVAELARRAAAALSGGTPPPGPALTADHLALARHDGAAVRVTGSRITIAAPDRPGLLWRAAGVLALHRLAVKTARVVSSPSVSGSAAPSAQTAVLDFTAVPEFGTPPDPAGLEADLRRMLAGRLDVAERLERRARSVRIRPGVTVPPPRVMIVDDASRTATVVEVRAHDRPGLLWRVGQALGSCGLQVRAAQVDTLGAEAVDVFYVVDDQGRPLDDPDALAAVRTRVLRTLR
ncbi:[protein-PII] uridylyltransferase [Actinomadura citrea]|uniref:Bifunctional uridylyltransferase/uridylyl-removing enzyme n=1 Tax=Actinomadura citrea TaxID=46158 RepID=A0A7Y9G8X7_9ACTN|nr:[protein-PII] uridylyltransferase [Actinomadura citrea]NYE12092.1 [protein-PII] uridylyltransferase [Actinomadura citrea]GGT49518.1 bifunctional uridylyltransferase/uridylyl-removing enzyme [Actinomadura citrea]